MAEPISIVRMTLRIRALRVPRGRNRSYAGGYSALLELISKACNAEESGRAFGLVDCPHRQIELDRMNATRVSAASEWGPAG
jgi:hypothetical protein